MTGDGDPGQRDGLKAHPGDDERFATDAVRQWTGDELPEAPHGRVQRDEHRNAGDGEPGCGEQHREQPQASPSLRLFTSPAWLAEDRARSPTLVWTNTARLDSPARRWS